MNDVTTQTGRKGRPTLFDPKEVEEQVADLFWDRGYEGVSMSDITTATGLSKSSLYNSFGGKDALFKAALARYEINVVKSGADWLAADDGEDPMQKLDQLLQGPANDVHGEGDTRGCFLCNTSADGQGRSPEIDTLVGEGFAKLDIGLQTLLRRYAPHAGSQAIQNTARLVLTIYTGMRVRSRTKPPRAAFDSVRETTLEAVRLLLKGD